MKQLIDEMKAFARAMGLLGIAVFIATGAEASDLNKEIKGSFILFETPNHVATGCDIATQMHVGEVDKDGEVTVVLHKTVYGNCRIAVEPEIRVYKASVRDIECGSRRFAGIRKHETGSDEVEITDHRTRTCRDF